MISTYEVRFPITITVVKRVRANDEDQARDIAENLFRGLSLEWNGNSVFCDGEAEEIEEAGSDCIYDVYDITELSAGDDKYDDYDSDSYDYLDEDEEDEEEDDEDEDD